MNVRRLPVLSVDSVGTPVFPRFVIHDHRRRHWTGEKHGFARSNLSPMLFAERNMASQEAHAILKHHFKGVEPQRYIVPVFVEVYSHDPVEPGEVASYLLNATSFNINVQKCGNGPNNSLVLPTIDWTRMEHYNEVPDDSAS